MAQRVNLMQTAPEAIQTMQRFEAYKKTTDFDEKLIELMKIRASQINGCAFCLDMHTRDARAIGETEQRIYNLNAWRECPFYSEPERAALALTEAVTLISTNGVPDEVYKEVRRHFDEKQYVDLVILIIAINGWNRLNVSVKTEPGSL